MQHRHPRQAGFTLAELAIVIVIIGLIIAATMSVREFSRNAELNSMINESKFYINQFNQFQTTYSAIAGDMANASSIWPSGTNGDGNGLVRAATVANTGEVFYVFQHLALAGFIKGNYTGATSGGVGTFYAKIGTNVPISQLTGITYMFDHPNALDGNVSADAFYFNGLYPNVLRVAGLRDTSTGLPDVSILTPKEALQVDLKFDDGAPNLGWILTPNRTALPNCTTAAVAYDSLTANGDVKNCYFILRPQ
jgi:prepilin-type N-terminal cleavage/methylation domain-containing protein